MVDVESDGPYPPDYSMISFGAVSIEKYPLKFFGLTRPISDLWIPEALEVSGYSREKTMGFPSPEIAMQQFAKWVKIVCKDERPMFISDNNGYDWQFINYYLWKFTGGNPFGHSSTNLGSLYKGMVKDLHKSFKHLRKTRHTHNPIDDAMGNVEAFLEMQKMGLKC